MATVAGGKRLDLRYSHTVGFMAVEGRGFTLPVDMAINREGKVYVVSRSNADEPQGVRVGIAGVDHQYFGHFGGYGSGPGQFMWPTSLAWDTQDRLYLADEHLHRITIFDKDGNYLDHWGTHGCGRGELDGPSGLALDAQDTLYVVDHKNHRVQRFTPDGKYLGHWGSFGGGPGQFNLPWGITVGPDGSVYVADWRNDRIQKFSAEGRFLASFGSPGRGDGQFHRPSSVAVDGEGYIYVADWGNHRVQVLAPDGTFVLKLRGQATLSPWAVEYLRANQDELEARALFNPYVQVDTDDPYEVSARIEPYFWGPISVKLDGKGRLYVLESNRHRFQVYRRE